MQDPSVLVIAEAGVNHNGDLGRARALVDAAAEAGANMVKFQTFQADKLAAASAKMASYQERNTAGSEHDNQVEMLRDLELSHADHDALIQHCRDRGIEFFSTAFDLESLDYLDGLGFQRHKIPSGEITNLPYLRKIASFQKDTILSTGMATMDDIENAIDALENGGLPRKRITVLHCTTEYPAPMEEVNLRAMGTIAEAFGVSVGYSDHTQGIEVAIAATALGASVIEKHFTLDRSLPGPDHAASLEPDELAAMISSIRNIEVALGSSLKQRTASERQNVDIARKSIVAARAIAEGEELCDANMTTKRPGTGMSPMLWDDVVGTPAPRAFGPDEEIEL